ncbi:MAG TPA: type II toxin-antitoxin system PemK/MazF family toxin [Desulfosporosinus sp.]|nr:type II toxin-antitoxin system PemK/MazF family toxin [Desulfosporosinus sp.]
MLIALKRGDVYRFRFPKTDNPSSSIIKYSVVLQEGRIVDNSPTVVCVNITTKKLSTLYPSDVLIDPNECQNTEGAKVICNQIHTISKERILDYQYSLSSSTMLDINDALMLGIGIVKIEDMETTGDTSLV